jgi:hypothetical protein
MTTRVTPLLTTEIALPSGRSRLSQVLVAQTAMTIITESNFLGYSPNTARDLFPLLSSSNGNALSDTTWDARINPNNVSKVLTIVSAPHTVSVTGQKNDNFAHYYMYDCVGDISLAQVFVEAGGTLNAFTPYALTIMNGGTLMNAGIINQKTWTVPTSSFRQLLWK